MYYNEFEIFANGKGFDSMKRILACVLAVLMLLSAVSLAEYDVLERTVVATEQCNIRSSPSLNGGIVGTAYKGDELYYMGKTSTDSRGVVWYMVEYNFNPCWVSSRYAKLEGGGTNSYVSDSSASIVYASQGDSNIRSAPDRSASIVGLFPQGASAVYLYSSTDDRGVVWYFIEYEANGSGIDGWVSSMYTSIR